MFLPLREEGMCFLYLRLPGAQQDCSSSLPGCHTTCDPDLSLGSSGYSASPDLAGPPLASLARLCLAVVEHRKQKLPHGHQTDILMHTTVHHNSFLLKETPAGACLAQKQGKQRDAVPPYFSNLQYIKKKKKKKLQTDLSSFQIAAEHFIKS